MANFWINVDLAQRYFKLPQPDPSADNPQDLLPKSQWLRGRVGFLLYLGPYFPDFSHLESPYPILMQPLSHVHIRAC